MSSHSTSNRALSLAYPWSCKGCTPVSLPDRTARSNGSGEVRCQVIQQYQPGKHTNHTPVRNEWKGAGGEKQNRSTNGSNSTARRCPKWRYSKLNDAAPKETSATLPTDDVGASSLLYTRSSPSITEEGHAAAPERR